MGTVAYLGFHKGGSNCCWPLVPTQRGPNYVLLCFYFYYVKKFFFLAKGGMAQSPPKYATVWAVFSARFVGSGGEEPPGFSQFTLK